MAICQYENSNAVYRFSCDKSWETVQDGEYYSVKEAIDKLPNQYRSIPSGKNMNKYEIDEMASGGFALVLEPVNYSLFSQRNGLKNSMLSLLENQ